MAISTQTQGLTGTWTIDPTHSLVEFSGKHMMFTTVKGRLTGVQGIIVTDWENPTASRVEAVIDAATVDTGNEQRDAHLRSADFLDVEHYPTITFRSTRIEPEGGYHHLHVFGDLTLRGMTREIMLDTTYLGEGTNPWGKEVAGFSAETTINRKDFGLNWNVALEKGGWLVSDALKIVLDVQAVRREDA